MGAEKGLGSEADGEGAWLSLPGPCKASLESRQCLGALRPWGGRGSPYVLAQLLAAGNPQKSDLGILPSLDLGLGTSPTVQGWQGGRC